MKECIAERKLLFSTKENSEPKELIIKVGAPYLVKDGDVNFQFTEGTAGCSIEFVGIKEVKEEVYGADLLQALQLAVNIEPILKRLSKKYTFFFPNGEPYFESN